MSTLIGILASTLGISWVVRDYIASLIAGAMIRIVKQIKPGRRIKVFTSPPLKGDVIHVGWFRTSLMEVGDGERLPSVRTGRMLQLFNTTLISNPVLIYGDEFIDEVVAYVESRYRDVKSLTTLMRRAMEEEGVEVMEVGLYQKEGILIIRGMYKSRPDHITDVRSRILEKFLEKVNKEKEITPYTINP